MTWLGAKATLLLLELTKAPQGAASGLMTWWWRHRNRACPHPVVKGTLPSFGLRQCDSPDEPPPALVGGAAVAT